MRRRDEVSVLVIRLSLGVGGSFLAAVFGAEAYYRGGMLLLFAIGVFLMVGLTVFFFARVKPHIYSLLTLLWLAFLLAIGLPH